jgi:hypothetical protein
MPTVLVAFACLAAVAFVGAQTQTFVAPKARVENVTFNRTGTTFTVTYDLVADEPSAANAVFEVTLEVTLDDGSLFRPVSVSGDMGRDVRVSPGTGKKIVWESSRDIDNQGYDLFKFAVKISDADLVDVSGAATPPADPPAGEPTGGAPPAPTTSSGLPGIWLGTYIDFPAQLEILQQDDASFSGVLYVVTKFDELATVLDVSGQLLENGQLIQFRETRVRERGGERSWNLGSASGRFASDRSAMAGDGTDGNESYQWMFARQASLGFESGAIWNGEYAGEPARLSIASRDGENWTGRLAVTTRDNAPPTNLRVEGTITGRAVEIREVELVSLGAESSWNLGTGIGTFESGGLQLIGAGTDSANKSYRFALLRGSR